MNASENSLSSSSSDDWNAAKRKSDTLKERDKSSFVGLPNENKQRNLLAGPITASASSRHNVNNTHYFSFNESSLGSSTNYDSSLMNHPCTCRSRSGKYMSYQNRRANEIKQQNVRLCTDDNSTSSDGRCVARVFYLISIHNDRTIQDALYTFRAIRDRNNIIAFHIDLKYGMEAYQNSLLRKEIVACPCGSTHIIVDSVHDCKWGAWSMNLPTLWAMEIALSSEYQSKWDVFINLSGDTLPVYTPDRISKLFGGPFRGLNFVTSSACETGLHPTPITYFPKHWHKRKHYSHRPPANLQYVEQKSGGIVKGEAITDRNTSELPLLIKNQRESSVENDSNDNYDNNYDKNTQTHKNNETVTTTDVDVYFGSQWMSVTKEFVRFITQELQRSDSLPSKFRDWLIETEKLMSDETFFSTMVMRYFPNTIPNISLLKSDKEDGDEGIWFYFEDDFDDVETSDGQIGRNQIKRDKHDPRLSSSFVNMKKKERSKMHAIRYERMDEHVPTSQGYFPIEQRYEVPESLQHVVEKPRPWGPYFLGIYDLNNIRLSGALFIRKVAQIIDPNLYKILPVDEPGQIPHISWPSDVQISPVPDWSKRLEQMHQNQKGQRKGQKDEEIESIFP